MLFANFGHLFRIHMQEVKSNKLKNVIFKFTNQLAKRV